MAVITPPELPPLIVNGTSRHKYVMTYKNVWDKERKSCRRQSADTVGRFVPDGDNPSHGEILFSDDFLDAHEGLRNFRVFRSKGGKLEFKAIDEDSLTVERRAATQKLHAGATWALNRIVSGTPIGRALARTFPERAMDRKLLSLAYFLCLGRDNALCNYEEFAECTWLPFQEPLRSGTISRLLRSITQDQAEAFLIALHGELASQYGNGISSHSFYALDSTSITTYSSMTSAEMDHNNDLADLPQDNVLLIVDRATGTPVYFRELNGNAPDVSTIRNAFSGLSRLGIADSSVVLVSDKGYVSTANIDNCLRNGLGFIFNTSVNSAGFARKLALENHHRLLDPGNAIPFLGLAACSVSLPWRYDSFPVSGKRQSRRDSMVHVHIYYDKDIHDAKADTLTNNLVRIREKQNTQPASVTPLERRYIELYMTERDGRTDIDMRKFAEATRLAGVRVLVSNTIADPLECYLAYNERNEVEYAFNTLKSRQVCNRARVHLSEEWRGKLLLEVVASAISGIVRRRLKEYNDSAIHNMSNYQVFYNSDTKVLGKLNNIMITRFRDRWYFDKIAVNLHILFRFLNLNVPAACCEILTKYDNDRIYTDFK